MQVNRQTEEQPVLKKRATSSRQIEVVDPRVKKGLQERQSRVNPVMAVIEEKVEEGGTVYMNNIKIDVSDKQVVKKPPLFQNVPRSVDLLLKKQEQICREIEMLDKKDKPDFITGGRLPEYQSVDQYKLEQKVRELKEIK